MKKIILVLTFTLSACAIGPDYKAPALDLPALSGDSISSDQSWWLIYNDAVLNKLIDEALVANHDLAAAAARVAEAEAQLGITQSDQVPTAYITADRNRNRNSLKSANYQPGFPIETTSNTAALNVSYEIDIWGKYRRATEAARADLLAVEANRDAVRLSLTAQLAQTYFALTALDGEVSAAKTMADDSRMGLALQKMRLDAGVISEFDYQQRFAELNAVLAQLPALENQRGQAERALNVLLGRSPRALLESAGIAKQSAATTAALPVFANMPSAAILQRPDIRAAEQQLIAANARIGVARSAYFPSISLTGLLGGQSKSLSDLFSGPARIWNYAGDLTAPLFAAGKINSSVDAALARHSAALAQYQSTIANAFREVQDAINTQSAAREISTLQQQRSEALGKAWKLAKLRYENGVASQIELIDNERNRLEAEMNYLEAQRQLRVSIADMFKALGGAVATH